MRLVLVLLVFLTASLALTACGGGRDDSPDEGAAAKTPGFPIRIVGLNEEFDVTETQAPAGAITITFENQDSGILHNIRLYEGSNADGRFVRKSELKRGPETQTLNLDLTPGSYFYDCEVHPASMTGSLVVK